MFVNNCKVISQNSAQIGMQVCGRHSFAGGGILALPAEPSSTIICEHLAVTTHTHTHRKQLLSKKWAKRSVSLNASWFGTRFRILSSVVPSSVLGVRSLESLTSEILQLTRVHQQRRTPSEVGTRSWQDGDVRRQLMKLICVYIYIHRLHTN